MSTLLDRPDVPDLTPAPARPDHDDHSDGEPAGFVDCRGVHHAWDEEDD